MTEPKVWLVTGGSRGLGRAVVVAAAESGARVMAAARRPDDVQDLVAAYPGWVEAVALDVTNPAAARRAVRDTVEAFGRLDVVVGGAVAAEPDELRERIEAELFGVAHIVEAALPVLLGRLDGTFVLVSNPGTEEVAPLGIRVIIVELGSGDGDPARAAQAIVRVVAEDDPPRRIAVSGAGDPPR